MAALATKPLTLDGADGEGGGQILRTALALSAVTGRGFSIARIRAKRPKPGLMRQHLTAVQAAAAICGATVDGAHIGSRELRFNPGPVRAGDYHFAIGSAGSTTLVFQTVLPPLLTAGAPSTVTLEGGTHNPFGPPLDFLSDAFLPVLARMGVAVDIVRERHGFNPAGGGRWRATITPARLSPIALHDRGRIVRRTATAVVAGLDGGIARRELDVVERLLGWDGDNLHIRQLPADEGPGNALLLRVESEHAVEVFSGIGRKGTSAEAVASEAAAEARRYLASTAPVGEHLADQLLIPFALAGGGGFTTTVATPHFTTNAAVVSRFTGVRWEMDHGPDGVRCVAHAPA